MPSNIDLVAELAQGISESTAPLPSAGVVLSDVSGDLYLHRRAFPNAVQNAPTADAVLMRAYIDGLAELYPTPGASPFTVDEVVWAVKGAIVGTGLVGAVNKLSQLNWPDRRAALHRLARERPTIDGMSYLGILQAEMAALPDVSISVRAAWIAAKLEGAGRDVSQDDLADFAKLIADVAGLGYSELAEVLICLGVPPAGVEGAVADMFAVQEEEPDSAGRRPVAPVVRVAPAPVTAVAIAASALPGPPGWFEALVEAVKGFDMTREDFGEYNNPNGVKYPSFIGTQIHIAIAAFYRLRHIAESPFNAGMGIWTNTSSIESIFNAIRAYAQFQGNASWVMAQAAALTRPDIFEMSGFHGHPPGWVYEIKPAGALGEGLVVAMREAVAYAMGLSAFGILAEPGSVTTDGVVGTLPAPGGWVLWTCPMPGAIVYKFIKVNNERYRRRFPKTSDRREKEQVNVALRAALATALAAALIVLAEGLLTLLAELLMGLFAVGWRLLFFVS